MALPASAVRGAYARLFRAARSTAHSNNARGVSHSSMGVADHQRREFEVNGAVCVRGVFSSGEIELIREGIEECKRTPSEYAEFLSDNESARSAAAGSGEDKGEGGVFWNDYCNWQRIPQFVRIVRESAAAGVAAALMNSRRVGLYHEHVLVKEGGSRRPTPWHHDQPYYPVHGRQLCSLWIPVDPVPLDASLQFIRGSHAWGKLFIPRKFQTEQNYELEPSAHARTEGDPAEGQRYETLPDIDAMVRRGECHVMSWDLLPGDCVVFHGATIHGARGANSLRRVLSLRFVGDDARLCTRPWRTSPPIDGGLRPGDRMISDSFPLVWECVSS